MKMLLAVLAGVSALAFSCGVKPGFNQAVGPYGWSFALSYGDLMLTDSERQTTAELRAQILRSSAILHSFQDSAVRAKGSPFYSEGWKSQLHVFGPHGSSRDFSWSNPLQASSSIGFGQCAVRGPQGAVLPCEAVALLECLESQSISGQSAATELNSSLKRSVLMSWLKQCGMPTAQVSRTGTEFRFAVQNGRAEFSPSPVFSILLFEGIWNSYEDANVQASTVASFADSSCTRADAACLRSPLSLSYCQGCENLKKGRLYTVFFIESLRQSYDVVQLVPYVH